MVRLCDGGCPSLTLLHGGFATGIPPQMQLLGAPDLSDRVFLIPTPTACSSSMAHFEDCKFFLRGACVNGERPFYAKRRRAFISNRDGRDG